MQKLNRRNSGTRSGRGDLCRWLRLRLPDRARGNYGPLATKRGEGDRAVQVLSPLPSGQEVPENHRKDDDGDGDPEQVQRGNDEVHGVAKAAIRAGPILDEGRLVWSILIFLEQTLFPDDRRKGRRRPNVELTPWNG